MEQNGYIEKLKLLNEVLSSRNLETFKSLIEEKIIDLDIRNDIGDTILHMTLNSGNIEMLEYLIENTNIDINSGDLALETILHTVCYHKDNELAKYLIENGADIYAANEEGYTPHDIIMDSRNEELRDFIINNDSDLPVHRFVDEESQSRLAEVQSQQQFSQELNLPPLQQPLARKNLILLIQQSMIFEQFTNARHDFKDNSRPRGRTFSIDG